MHSSIERILIAARALPADLKVIFDEYVMNGSSIESVCSSQKITEAQFHERHAQLMREMRAMG